MEGLDNYPFSDLADPCLVPAIIISPKFKVPYQFSHFSDLADPCLLQRDDVSKESSSDVLPKDGGIFHG